MPLTQCPECKKDVSAQATTCPHCGRLRKYVCGFYGYGSWSSKIWFIGYEEGGGGNRYEIEDGNIDSAQGELKTRLDSWDQHSHEGLANAQTFLPAIGIKKWFGEDAKVQRTWIRLIWVLLGLGEISPPCIPLCYQAFKWGLPHSGVCDLSLFPLPSPSSKVWAYEHPDFQLPAEFKKRKLYEDTLSKGRIAFLMGKISAAQPGQPGIVIFYGSSVKNVWERTTNQQFNEYAEIGKTTIWRFLSREQKIQFISIPHPNKRRAKNEEFKEIGCVIRNGIWKRANC